MSDLIEKIQWAKSHEPEVLRMIENAQKFASENLRYEDVYRYFYLVLQKYANFQQIDFEDLKRATRKDSHWINIQYRKRLAVYKMFVRQWDHLKTLIFLEIKSITSIGQHHASSRQICERTGSPRPLRRATGMSLN